MKTYRYFDEDHEQITKDEFFEAARRVDTLCDLLESLGYKLSDFDVVDGYNLDMYEMDNDIKDYLRRYWWNDLPEALLRIRHMHIEEGGLYTRDQGEPLAWRRIDDTPEGLEDFSNKVYWILDDDGFFKRDEDEEEADRDV